MSGDTTELRGQLTDDYHGALIRLATLRADGEHYLLFAWVELYPFDMDVPDGWTAGKAPWPVPGIRGWSCGFSAKGVTVAEALDWYEAAATGNIDIGQKKESPAKVQMVRLGAEPVYGRFCTGVDAPFALLWHGGPRIHRYVPLSANPLPVRRLGANGAARAWLERHVGFDPYRFEEWLGGLALVAPDPICSAVAVFPSARAEDDRETLTIQAIPRRSVARGIADFSSLSIHVAERRADGWSSLHTVALGSGGFATIVNPQPWNKAAYALVCSKRGLLRFVEPLSWIEQIGMGVNISSAAVVEVPSGGRRKPKKEIPVERYVKGADILVGKASTDVVRQRLISIGERRKAREKRTEAPQKVFGIAHDKTTVSETDIKQRQKEAEDFIGSLVAGARRRVLFVDSFFGFRETRLFALRVSNHGVTPRILTGLPGLEAKSDGTAGLRILIGDRLVADVAQLAQVQGIQAPEVRVMPGGNKPVIHDRYLVVDNDVWHCGPSFNELGERLGVMVRLPDPLSVRRFLSAIWGRSSPLAEFWQKFRSSSDGKP